MNILVVKNRNPKDIHTDWNTYYTVRCINGKNKCNRCKFRFKCITASQDFFITEYEFEKYFEYAGFSKRQCVTPKI